MQKPLAELTPASMVVNRKKNSKKFGNKRTTRKTSTTTTIFENKASPLLQQMLLHSPLSTENGPVCKIFPNMLVSGTRIASASHIASAELCCDVCATFNSQAGVISCQGWNFDALLEECYLMNGTNGFVF
jgi:hypothetical protein